MSADGSWNLTINSPMGAQASVLNLKVEGGALTGDQAAQGNTQPIVNGKIDGDTVTWSNSITTPFPMTLEFTGKVDGDSLNGSVKAGAFGSFPFTGKRA
jgi:hypothetical protein